MPGHLEGCAARGYHEIRDVKYNDEAGVNTWDRVKTVPGTLPEGSQEEKTRKNCQEVREGGSVAGQEEGGREGAERDGGGRCSPRPGDGPDGWDEHDLEYQIAVLGLDDDDLCLMEVGGCEPEQYGGELEHLDWLDDWMASLSKEDCTMVVKMDKKVEEEDMELEDMEAQEVNKDFMTWLVCELEEMHIDGDIIEKVSECVRTVSCPGECQDLCDIKDTEECIRTASCPGGCQDQCNLEGGIEHGGGSSLHEGQGNAQECGDRHGSVQAVHTVCTPVQRNNFSMGAVDWARVGGVVLEETRVFMNDKNIWKPKYMPDWDNLPVWVHPHFKPSGSRQQDFVRKEVGEEKAGKHTNELKCNATTSRIRKRGGRVSGIVRTLEEGAKQKNKIFSYFSKFAENGHPLAKTQSDNFGIKRRMEESEVECAGVTGGSARKRTKET